MVKPLEERLQQMSKDMREEANYILAEIDTDLKEVDILSNYVKLVKYTTLLENALDLELALNAHYKENYRDSQSAYILNTLEKNL